MRAFIITAIFTGMRASELHGLTWKDVKLDAAMVHIRQRADAWRNMGPPKSAAGTRDIPLVPMAVNALRQWQENCPEGTARAQSGYAGVVNQYPLSGIKRTLMDVPRWRI